MKHSVYMVTLVLTLITGCAAVPFAPMSTPALLDPDPAAMRSDWAGALPKRFTTEDTVIIEFPGNFLAFLGYLRVDRTSGTFDVQGMNHMGMRAFVISGDLEKSEVLYAAPPLAEQPKVLRSIAGDIRRLFFDLVPDQASRVRTGKRSVRFIERRMGSKIEYIFGGEDGVLLDKRCTKWGWLVWRVRFYEYTHTAGGLYPRGMVLDNSRYHYRIVVKNRSLQIEEDADTR